MSGATIDESAKFLLKPVVDVISLQRRKVSEGNLTVTEQAATSREIVKTLKSFSDEQLLPKEAFANIFQFHVFTVSQAASR